MFTLEKPMTEQDLLAQLDAIVDEHHLLKHAFYQLWNEGKLTLTALQEYAKEYYHQVHFFPTYVSATHAACDDLSVRQMLLENLIEEERGANHHPELWLRFAEGLGVDRDAVLNHEPAPDTKESVQTLKALSRSENPAVGMAALYAYESQIPAVSTTKIAGLKDYYGIESEAALSFFQVHEQADAVHSQMTRDAIAKLCKTPDDQAAAINATETAVKALNQLLDGVYAAHC